MIGDTNNDGMVDVGDLGILAANYGQINRTCAQGDFNDDGLVDVGDLGILAAHYDEGTSALADFNTDYPGPSVQWTVRSRMMIQAEMRMRVGIAAVWGYRFLLDCFLVV
jgi:hypothetical protein